MKSQLFRTELKEGEHVTYRLYIPIEYHQMHDQSEAPSYRVAVYDGNNAELPLQFEKNHYMLERNDPAGRHSFRVKLNNGDEIIEEQEIIIVIQKKTDADYLVDPMELIKVVDNEFETAVLETIEKMQLTVGHQTGFMTMATSPVIVDKDSESIYRELKKYQRDDEVIRILCKTVHNQIANGSLIWKTVKIFFYYRAVEGVYFINALAQQKYADNNLTRFVHETCVKYLEAVNTVRNKELVMKSLVHYSLECISPQARTLSVKSLSSSGKQNDFDIVEILIRVNNEDSDITTRLEAIRGLAKYNLTSFKSSILEVMQDASPQIRREIGNSLLNTTLIPDFTFVVELFENETDDGVRSTLGKFIYNKYPDKAREYFLQVIDYQEEKIIAAVLDIIYYTSDTFAVDKFKQIHESAVLSPTIQKRLEEYLKKATKSS